MVVDAFNPVTVVRMTIVAKLRAAATTFDRATLSWVADGFAAERYVTDASALSSLLAELDDSLPDLSAVFKACAAGGAFAPFAVACLARHAGLGSDVTHRGALQRGMVVAGNLKVEGPIVLTTENWLLVAGNVEAEGLIVASDVIVAGDLVARDGILGVNSWNQSMWVHGSVHTPTFVVEDYSVEADIEPDELASDDVDEKFAEGLAEQIREWQSDGGPDEVIEKLAKHIRKRAVFVGS